MNITPKMLLRVWNALGDHFDHSALADNFTKIDAHEHTEGHGAQIPTGGIVPLAIDNTLLGPSSVSTDKIQNLAVTHAKLAPGSVTSSNLALGAGRLTVLTATPGLGAFNVSEGTIVLTGTRILDLPAATDGSMVGIMSNTGAASITINCAGTDHIYTALGSFTTTGVIWGVGSLWLLLANGAVWYPVSEIIR